MAHLPRDLWTNVTSWASAGQLAYPDATKVDFYFQSRWTLNSTWATTSWMHDSGVTATCPVVEANLLNSRPALRFTQASSQYMTCLSTALFSASAKSMAFAFRLRSAPIPPSSVLLSAGVWPTWACILRDDLVLGIYTCRAQNVDAGGIKTCDVSLDASDFTSWHYAVVTHGSNLVTLAFDSVNTADWATVASTATTSSITQPQLGRAWDGTLGVDAGGSRFLGADIGEVITWNSALTTAQIKRVLVYLEEAWGNTGDPTEQARSVASRRLFEFRDARRTPEFVAKLRVLDYAPGDTLALSHETQPGGLDETAGGQHQAEVLSIDVDGDALTAKVKAASVGHRSATLWETFAPDEATSPESILGEGCGIVCTPGATRLFAREGYAYDELVGTDGLLGQWGGTAWVVNDKGILLQRNRTQAVYSSGGAPNYGWTPAAGNNGATVGWVDNTDLALFAGDCRVGTNWQQPTKHYKLVGGNNQATNTANGAYCSVGTSLTQLQLSLWHRDDVGSPMIMRLSRISDGKYLKEDGTWNVGAYDLPIPEQTSSLRADLRYDLYIPVTDGPDTYHIYVMQPAGMPALAVNEWWLVQAELGAPYPMSPMLPTEWFGDAGPSFYAVTNADGARTWPAAHGTCLVSWRPYSWDTNDTRDHIISRCYHDADNYADLRWNGSTLQWEATVCVAGTAATAYLPVANSPITDPTAWKWAAIRWTGTDEELGLDAYTVDVFVDGVKGTSAVAAGAMTEANYSLTYLGSGEPGAQILTADDTLDGYVRERLITPRVFTDDEIDAWGRGI
jgi:hypothetical protein